MLLGLDDTVLELAITANRPDGLSMTGIAREVAALTDAELSLPETAEPPAIHSLNLITSSAVAMQKGGQISCKISVINVICRIL